MLRLITEGKLAPEEAVRAYHAVLEARQIKPRLPLEKDLELTEAAMSYNGGNSRGSVAIRNNPLAEKPGAERSPQHSRPSWPHLPNGAPDFEKMNAAQRRAYDQERLTRRFR
jgi:hypothetical protein